MDVREATKQPKVFHALLIFPRGYSSSMCSGSAPLRVPLFRSLPSLKEKFKN